MTDYTIMVDNVPFRVRGATSREQAQRAVEARFHDPDAKRQAILKRKAKLLEMGIDVDANPIGDMSGGEKFLVGAGRTFTETARGIKQMWYGARGDEEKVNALAREEALHRDTFDMLDSQGIGMEDLGQLAPELTAFIGSGGTSGMVNLGLRSAAVGGSKATVEGESRGMNATISGLLGAGTAGAAKGALAMFQKGAQLTGAAASGLQRLAGLKGGNTPGGLANHMSSAITQAQHMANSKDAAMRKIGQESLAQLRGMVHGMNNVGKESLFRTQLNQLMQASIRQVENGLVLDTAAFAKGLEQVSKSQLTKELGRTFGPRIDALRNTFLELGKVSDLDDAAATNILQKIMSDDSAAAVAQQISREAQKRAAAEAAGEATQQAAKPGVMEGLLRTLGNTVSRTPQAVAAGAGPETGDIVEDILREWDKKDIRIE